MSLLFLQGLVMMTIFPVGMVSAALMLPCCVMEYVIAPTGQTKENAVTISYDMFIYKRGSVR